MAKKKKVTKCPDGGSVQWRTDPPDANPNDPGGYTSGNPLIDLGTSITNGIDPSFILPLALPAMMQLTKGMEAEKNAKQADVFNPMKGFHGFNYAAGGGIPQGPQEQGLPNTFNNQQENHYPLGSFLPFILDDPRNTVNAGKRKPMSIQTEKGEFITSPFGDIVQVAAKKKHKDMEDDEVTDITSEGNYIISNSKSMRFKKGQKIKGIGMDSLTLGRSPIYYKEGEIAMTPKVYKLSDIEPNKSKYTPADAIKKVAKKYPLTDRENDPFATRAQVENKQSRIPYIKALVALSELKKVKPVPQFSNGGTVAPIDNAIKFNRFQIPQLDNLYKIPEFPGGGPVQYGGGTYQYEDYTNKNRRKQFNSWLDQASSMYQDYFLNDFAQANDQTSMVEAATVLGQNKFKGTNEYLYGNQYLSRLDNLQNQQDRSMNAEQAYYQSAGDRENSIIRQGLNAGYAPNQFAGMRTNSIREGNAAIANLGKERRNYTDRYGSTRLTATDTYAGRQNQQKAYETEFANNQLQNLGAIATKNIAGRLQAKSGALGAATQFQLAKTPGNALTDTFKAVQDLISLGANVAGMISGFGNLGGNNQQQGWNQNMGGGQGGYQYTGPTGPTSNPNSFWSGMQRNIYNTGFNAPIMMPQPTGNPNIYDPTGWGPGYGGYNTPT